MSESNILLDEVTKTLNLIGFKRMIASLKTQRQLREHLDPHITFVILLVCQEYGVEFSALVDSTTTHPEVSVIYARAFIVHYLRCDFKITWPDLKILFRRKSKVSIYNWSKTIPQLKPGIGADKEHATRKMILDEKIKQYIKQLKK